MNKKVVITIGRQYGSGGRNVGKLVAKKLGIDFYDKELITLAAKQNGMSEHLFESVDERPTNSLLYSLAVGAYGMDGNYSYWGDAALPLNDRVYQIQAGLIEELADKGSCVIVGRCADYVLRDRDNVVNVFLMADKEYRKKKAIESYQVPAEKAADVIKKTDKKRANYYNYHTNREWSDASNYHICVDVGAIGEEKCADLIVSYVQLKFS